MERRRYLGRNHRFKTFSSKTIRVDESRLKGYASFVQVEEVTSPLINPDGTRLFDDGYSVMNFLPDDELWYLHAIYDDQGNIIEWYFDITRKNAIDEDGNPYCDDIYLDVVLLPDGQILVLDEDELKDALDSGEITQKESDTAYETLNGLKQHGVLNVAYMETFCLELKSLLFLEKPSQAA